MLQTFHSNRKDLFLVRIHVRGKKDAAAKEGVLDLVDYSDNKFTSMERCTGFGVGIVAAWIAGLYDIEPKRGAFAPFQHVPPQLVLDELSRCGMEFNIREIPE